MRYLGRAVPCLLLLTVAGCGGHHHAASHTTASSTTTSTTTAPTTQPATVSAASTASWPTYDRDNGRSGFDPKAPTLKHPHRVWSASVNGDVYAQPLVANGKVIVATEGDSVYAFDIRRGHKLWQANLGTPVPGSDLPCGNIDPSGITGTPVIDLKRKTVFAVTFTRPGRHRLVALNLDNGHVRWRRGIDAPGQDPKVQQERAALALSHGRVYVAYGGLFGDCGDYHGWVVGASATHRSGGLITYRVPAQRKAGIWAPPGPSVDGAGNLYVATGNGVSSSFDFGNAVIKLSPRLHRTGYFAPKNAASLNGPDADFGSTGPVLLPNHRAFAIGKSGIGYVLDTSHLGGVGGQLSSANVCSSAYGASAYARSRIYVPCTDGLVALRLSHGRVTTAWRSASFTAGPPIVTGGRVWTIDTGSGTLYELDARSGKVRFQRSVGSVTHFATPAEAGGRLFVPAGSQIIAFGG